MDEKERVSTETYILVIGCEGNSPSAQIYFKQKELRLKYRTPMIYTYNGNVWLKPTSGKPLRTEQIAHLLEPEHLQKIQEHFKKP